MTDRRHKTDRQSFLDAMKDVRRLKHDRIVNIPARPKAQAKQYIKDQQQVLLDMMSDPPDDMDIATGEELFFARTGLQTNTLRKLKRGQFSIQSELDLHGQTAHEAKCLVAEFLLYCRNHKLRVVRIIHGKGHGSLNKLPVLKTKVNYWLQQRDEVLAFCSARQVDGGTGAIYVLLKRK